MTKRLNKISPYHDLILKWMGWCDEVFHWLIALVVLFSFAGFFMTGTAIGAIFTVLAISLFLLITIPFILVKLFMPDMTKESREHIN